MKSTYTCYWCGTTPYACEHVIAALDERELLAEQFEDSEEEQPSPIDETAQLPEEADSNSFCFPGLAEALEDTFLKQSYDATGPYVIEFERKAVFVTDDTELDTYTGAPIKK